MLSTRWCHLVLLFIAILLAIAVLNQRLIFEKFVSLYYPPRYVNPIITQFSLNFIITSFSGSKNSNEEVGHYLHKEQVRTTVVPLLNFNDTNILNHMNNNDFYNFTDIDFLPFCQRSDQFITFKDTGGGAGFNHKYSDFVNAFKLAVNYNRTLVDYTPRLSSHHNPSLHGGFYPGWRFWDFIDFSNMTYQIYDEAENSTRRCRLRVLRSNEHRLHYPDNTLTIEFGRDKKFFMIKHIRLSKSIVSRESKFKDNFSNIKLLSDAFQASRFFKLAAEYVKSDIFRMAARIQNSNGPFNLTVMHIRGTDRGCMVKKFNDKQLVDRIASFGLPQKNGVVYVMTNMPKQGKHFKAIQRYFANHSFFESRDIALFKRKEFIRMGSYLVYVVEKQMQRIAESLVVTYPGYVNMGFKEKLLGILAPPECGHMG